VISLAQRFALRTFGVALPGRAAQWFENMLLTPRPAGHGGVPTPRAAPERSRLPYGNGWLALHAWGSGPTILLVHGWGGAAGSMGAFVDPLVDAGFRVVAYDAPAHGGSDGVRTNLIECAGAALQVGRAFGRLHGILAHSFGAPTAALAMRHGLASPRSVFLGPPVSIIDLSMKLGTLLGLPRRVGVLMAERLARRLRFEWQDLRTDRLVERVDTPLLVVHDEDDRTVPWTHGAAIARAAPRGRLVTTRGLGHRGLLLDADVIRRTTGFLADAGDTERHPA
jgi:pimeloyl-ACP methyl ester carboxylesterase